MTATFYEDKTLRGYKFDVPLTWGPAASGELFVHVALNGVQYVTSDQAKFTYVDMPLAPQPVGPDHPLPKKKGHH